MLSILPHIIIYLISFVALWFGAGLVVSAVTRLSRGWRLPEFTVSFFILGVMTSLPELAIGLTAVASGDPGIFVGNLVGGIVVLFLFIIPLLAMVGKGIKPPKELNRVLLLSILVVAFLPSIAIADRQVTNVEGLLAIGFYLVLFVFFSRDQSILENLKKSFKRKKSSSMMDILKIIAGIAILIVGSNQIVVSTVYFAKLLDIAPFFVSLVIVSLGTNIPEITLIFRSLFQKKQTVALADYLGSASANTLVFGILVLLYPTAISIPNHYFHRFVFIIVGLALFYFFLRSNSRLNKRESIVLLLLYISFVMVELLLV